MKLNISAIKMSTDIPECKTAEIRHAIQAGDHLNSMTAYMMNDWLSNREKVKEEIQTWLYLR